MKDTDRNTKNPSGCLSGNKQMIKHNRPWWRWPEDRSHGVSPWYKLAWRAIFWPILVIGFGLSWLALLCSYGLDRAVGWWMDST